MFGSRNKLRNLPSRLRGLRQKPVRVSHEPRRIPIKQGAKTIVSLVCWILLYGVGLLAESVEQRIMLSPHTMKMQLGENGQKLMTEVSKTLEKDDRSFPKTTAFLQALLVYTPTNMAILTLLAGFLGGCVSNVKYSMMDDDERRNLTKEQDAILSETPLAATMRAFVIYLCLVTGLYAATNDPFKDSTPAQYARLAGSMSLVAFVVGFDPSRIKVWLRMADNKYPSNASGSDGAATKS